VFPELRMTHLIPAERVTEPYLLRLIHDHAYSHGILRRVLFGEEPRRLGFGEAVRILLHGLRRGRFSMKCRWAAARGSEGAARVISVHGDRLIESNDDGKASLEVLPEYTRDRRALRLRPSSVSQK
jgi:hypothetical protein